MIAGTAYGVVLNDRQERASLDGTFGEAPYGAPPRAPVVYIKPRACIQPGNAPIILPQDLEHVQVGATLALIFARDCGPHDNPLASFGAACLALDIRAPASSYFRPAIHQMCRDGFLPLGELVHRHHAMGIVEIVTRIDGFEAHRWSLERLVRPVDELVRSLAEFMTLKAGDLLMVGLAGDAPLAGADQRIVVTAPGFPALSTHISRPR